MTRISRRLFLSGAALLGAGIAIDRVGKSDVSMPFPDQSIPQSDKPIINIPDVQTPTLYVPKKRSTLVL